ncbi:hypothetical protein FOXG_17451 [Fusarium oxysporum f. sp. lycopersici 4287]|uniref:NAD dependent epimerase/dehydratase n=2 Tax=Fusarium oxysporum TaxID=5507 RepID=A0A0J9WCU9_FUSO4|nr:hypothetical protein FOXG_17451 [Fusarium oxysporum f. sp. lycopersici 4287]EWZ78004.1 hypothetical protein FOWG_17665 [Fusarium oxysporum f. sp. lycopersici MN25]KAJ9413817.1 hypothetical protein QL093DRAFT_2500961 [Fusarium oxysporum]KNB20456.1 hypothetical protein FOXG_17451 [Fusarium oxysporum f. sp. lycopersici 4287]
MSHIGGQAVAGPKPGAKFVIIGAGMSRTGTKSFGEALSILLDGPVHDAGVQCNAGPRVVGERWLEALELGATPPSSRTKTQDTKIQYLLSELTEGYVATVDWPANFMTDELMQLHPDAIVICTTRDPESWGRSLAVLGQVMNNWYFPILVSVLPKVGLHARWRQGWENMVRSRYEVPSSASEYFSITTHEDYLRRNVPQDKLHFYSVGSGWEPLCEILGVNVPNVPFPYRNRGDDIRRTYRNFMFAGAAAWTGIFGSAFATWWVFLRGNGMRNVWATLKLVMRRRN